LNRSAVALGFAAAVVVFGAMAHGVSRGAASAQPAPGPSESAIIELQEGPGPGPTPTPTPRRRGRGKPSPTPSPTPLVGPPAPTPTPSPTPSPVPTAVPPVTAQPTVIPTARPTPRPVAPFQPSIPQSLEDPNVQSILHRQIAQLSQLSWMTGTWRAHNVEELGDGRQHDLGLNTYVFAPIMKGRWMFGGDGKGTDFFYITYDPFAQRWTLVRLNETPAYGIWISDRGWRGNSISFTTTYSYAVGRQYARRLTIIHKDARTWGIYDEEQLSDGSWTGDDAVELTKQQ